MRVVGGRQLGLVSVQLDGPWECERCKMLTQFGECKNDINRIFCVNEHCRFVRIIDKRNRRIMEADGSVWQYDPVSGRKVRVRSV